MQRERVPLHTERARVEGGLHQAMTRRAGRTVPGRTFESPADGGAVGSGESLPHKKYLQS